jgi:putative transposase
VPGCSVSGTPRSTQWQRAGRVLVADRQRHDQHRAAIARQAWVEHWQVYGARRLTTELHERGHHWNRKSGSPPDAPGRHRKARTAAAAAGPAAIRIDGNGPGPGPAAVHRRGTRPVVGRRYLVLRTWEGFVYLAVVGAVGAPAQRQMSASGQDNAALIRLTPQDHCNRVR